MSHDWLAQIEPTETLPAEFQQVEELALELQETWLQSIESKIKDFLGVY